MRHAGVCCGEIQVHNVQRGALQVSVLNGSEQSLQLAESVATRATALLRSADDAVLFSVAAKHVGDAASVQLE